MPEIHEFTFNKYIIVPMFIWLGIQIFKTIWDLVKEKKFNLKEFLEQEECQVLILLLYAL